MEVALASSFLQLDCLSVDKPNNPTGASSPHSIGCCHKNGVLSTLHRGGGRILGSQAQLVPHIIVKVLCVGFLAVCTW